MDILLVRENDHLLFDLYSKPTNSNRLLNFKSHHPLHQKISIVKQLKCKVDKLCSDVFKGKNIKLLKEKLRVNNYPWSVVNRIFHNGGPQGERSNNKNKNENENDKNKNNKNFIRIPFHKDLAPKINRIFKPYNKQVAFYNTKTNKRFGNVKGKTPNLQQSDVVYELSCQCQKKYIGQTKQRLKNRIQQHKNDIKNGSTNTGLSNHVNITKHNVEWDNVKILEKENNVFKRLFLEFAHITSNDENEILNLQTDFKKGSMIYKNVLNKF